jgi:hypothetical protein
MLSGEPVIGEDNLQVLPSKKELTCPHIHNCLLNKLVFTDLKEVRDSSIVSSLTFPYTEIIMVGRLTLLRSARKV